VSVAKIGRNEACPCGSGRKVKHCCGTDAAATRLERTTEALGEALALATHFPRLRPRGDELARWAESVVWREPTRALIEAGVSVAGRDELDRMVDEYASGAPDAWRSLCDDVGSEEDAATALVTGAVLAAVAEHEPPDEELLCCWTTTESTTRARRSR
jgi:SEC-C motif